MRHRRHVRANLHEWHVRLDLKASCWICNDTAGQASSGTRQISLSNHEVKPRDGGPVPQNDDPGPILRLALFLLRLDLKASCWICNDTAGQASSGTRQISRSNHEVKPRDGGPVPQNDDPGPILRLALFLLRLDLKASCWICNDTAGQASSGTRQISNDTAGQASSGTRQISQVKPPGKASRRGPRPQNDDPGPVLGLALSCGVTGLRGRRPALPARNTGFGNFWEYLAEPRVVWE